MIRVGIIGTGVGVRTHLPAFQAAANATVIAIAGRDPARTRSITREHGVPHALDAATLISHPDVDLVCVASPPLAHVEHASGALACGKHVLCEKPLALSHIDTMRLVDEAATRPAQLSLVNHQLRFNECVVEAKRLVRTGSIGRPYFVRLHQQSAAFVDRAQSWSWNFDERAGGGVRLAMGSHQIDLLQFLLDEEVVAVQGSMDPVIRERQFDSAVTRSVLTSGFYGATLETQSGVIAHLSAISVSSGLPEFAFSIYGEDGELHFDLVNQLRGADRAHRGALSSIEVIRNDLGALDTKLSFFGKAFTQFATAIADALTEHSSRGLDNAARFSDAVRVQVVLDMIARTAETGTLERIGVGQVRAPFV